MARGAGGVWVGLGWDSWVDGSLASCMLCHIHVDLGCFVVAGSKHPPRLTLLAQMPKTGETSLDFFKFSFMFKAMLLKGLVGYKLL